MQVLRYLVEHRSARFKDIAKVLDPISPASQMRLLRTLADLGEIEKNNNKYRLSSTSMFRVATSPHPFALRQEISNQLDDIIRRLARQTSYPAALFGWITPGTIMILNSYSPVGSDTQYRPAGEEWPLIPFHDFAQLFLAYAPDFMREDAFFRWNPYLNDAFKSANFQAFVNRLNTIQEQGFTISDVIDQTFGSIVQPVMLHGESLPRFAVGVLASDKPDASRIEYILAELKAVSGELASVLKGGISPKQLELDLSHSQLVVQNYVDPYNPRK